MLCARNEKKKKLRYESCSFCCTGLNGNQTACCMCPHPQQPVFPVAVPFIWHCCECTSICTEDVSWGRRSSHWRACCHMQPRPPAWDLSYQNSVRSQCVGCTHTCAESCPLVITSPRSRINEDVNRAIAGKAQVLLIILTWLFPI